MARSFSYTDGYLKWFFLLSLSLAGVAFLLCVVFLGLAYHRQTYWYLPLLSELHTPRELYKQIYLRGSYTKRDRGTSIHRKRNKRWTISSSTSWNLNLLMPLTKTQKPTTDAATFICTGLG